MAQTKVSVQLGAKTIELPDSNLRFADEYLIDLNATQAAIRAGFSAKTASSAGSRLLKNVKVRAYIDYHMALIHRRCGVSAERIVRELACTAFVNPDDVINFASATVKGDAVDHDMRAIQSVKVKVIPTEDGEIVEREIRLNDKNRALELLGKREKMWIEKVESTNDTEITVVLDDQSADWAK